MNRKFKDIDEFTNINYKLLPFRFERINPEKILIVNEVGEYLFIKDNELKKLVDAEVIIDEALFSSLKQKNFIYGSEDSYALRCLASKYKQRKSFLKGGPGLHIFVLTLRCANSCEYCQANRKSPSSSEYDMTFDTARHAVNRMFESPNKNLTIEFQGGEPLLAFDLLKFIVNYVQEKNLTYNKNIIFVIATSLQIITDEMLEFIKSNELHISTSLDGHEWLHNKNRPSAQKNSYRNTLDGIKKCQEILGKEYVAAMTTITRDSLIHYKEIIDEYIAHGFHSIFLRPLNMYGFAVKKRDKISYTAKEYFEFYKQGLNYIIQINKEGYYLDEVTASLALNNILSGNAIGYVDLRSPCGDGTGVMVYHYNGYVYPSDESRMLCDMGDNKFCLGHVTTDYKKLIQSDVMKEILLNGVAEALPGCAYCVYLPYCGANPIQNYSKTGNLCGHRSYNDFCDKQKLLYQHLFSLIDEHEEIFSSWITKGR